MALKEWHKPQVKDLDVMLTEATSPAWLLAALLGLAISDGDGGSGS